MPQTIYLTAWKGRRMLREGCKAVVRPEAFRWDGSAGSHNAEAAELEARLNLALALLESVGIEAHFSYAPGDVHGDTPEGGYLWFGEPVPGGNGDPGEP